MKNLFVKFEFFEARQAFARCKLNSGFEDDGTSLRVTQIVAPVRSGIARVANNFEVRPCFKVIFVQISASSTRHKCPRSSSTDPMSHLYAY